MAKQAPLLRGGGLPMEIIGDEKEEGVGVVVAGGRGQGSVSVAAAESESRLSCRRTKGPWRRIGNDGGRGHALVTAAQPSPPPNRMLTYENAYIERQTRYYRCLS